MKKPIVNGVTDAQSSVLWNIVTESAIRSFNGEESKESFNKSVLNFKSKLNNLIIQKCKEALSDTNIKRSDLK